MEKDDLLKLVLDHEWAMFVAVKGTQPASCQSSPEKFRAIRGSIFEMWPEEMLVCYLLHLSAAVAEGRNLLTEKYARMDNLIPPLTSSPHLDRIVEIFERWQRELKERYPVLCRHCCRSMEPTGDGRNFSVYLRSELETYGDDTLALYHAHVERSCRQHRNLSIEALESLVRKSGYAGLEHAEACLGRVTATKEGA